MTPVEIAILSLWCGLVGALIGYSMKPAKHYVSVTIDASVIKAYVEKMGLVIVPKGVDWKPKQDGRLNS